MKFFIMALIISVHLVAMNGEEAEKASWDDDWLISDDMYNDVSKSFKMSIEELIYRYQEREEIILIDQRRKAAQERHSPVKKNKSNN